MIGIGFLEGVVGRDFFDEYQKTISEKYRNFEALEILNVLDYIQGVVSGLNSYAGVHADQILRKRGLRIATQADIEKDQADPKNKLDLIGKHADTALVLLGMGHPNFYLARDLMNQIREKTGKEPEFPIMIPLTGLELRIDDNANHGLAFNLTDKSKLIYAPQLSFKNDGKKFSETDENGLPIYSFFGKRTFYATDKEGLSKLSISRSQDLGTDFYNLTDSDLDGRIVAVAD
jgi:hypothetical protein